MLWEGADEVVVSGGIEGEVGRSSFCKGDITACVAGIKSNLANCSKVMYSSGEVEDCKVIHQNHHQVYSIFGIPKASKAIEESK